MLSPLSLRSRPLAASSRITVAPSAQQAIGHLAQYPASFQACLPRQKSNREVIGRQIDDRRRLELIERGFQPSCPGRYGRSRSARLLNRQKPRGSCGRGDGELQCAATEALAAERNEKRSAHIRMSRQGSQHDIAVSRGVATGKPYQLHATVAEVFRDLLGDMPGAFDKKRNNGVVANALASVLSQISVHRYSRDVRVGV